MTSPPRMARHALHRTCFAAPPPSFPRHRPPALSRTSWGMRASSHLGATRRTLPSNVRDLTDWNICAILDSSSSGGTARAQTPWQQKQQYHQSFPRQGPAPQGRSGGSPQHIPAVLSRWPSRILNPKKTDNKYRYTAPPGPPVPSARDGPSLRDGPRALPHRLGPFTPAFAFPGVSA